MGRVRARGIPRVEDYFRLRKRCEVGGNSQLLGIETGEYSRISQLLICGEKDAVLRSVFTPFQRRSQLKRVCGPQVEAIHKFDRRRAHTFRRLNYGPQFGKFFGQIRGFGPVEGIDCLHSLKSGQRTCYLDRCRPPHDDVIAPIRGKSRAALCSAARKVEPEHLRPKTLKLAFPAAPLFPPYLFYNLVRDISRGLRPRDRSWPTTQLSGSFRRPFATSRCSCSECSSKRKGMMRATGLFRSHTSTSSPSRTS